jgi:pimeloyl-ACP methyl ester carboxylesterase
MPSRGRLSWVLGLAVAASVVTACSGESSTPREAPSPVAETAEPVSPAATVDGSTDLILDVDLAGRRMHVTCFGPMVDSEPIVLFEAGGGTTSDTWDAVVDALVPTHRTCSYDRAGVGGSEPAPEPRRTTKDLVADLERTLELAGIEGPFVLVGHSMAVWPLAVYAAAHPNDVAGVVLVDPRAPHVSSRYRAALPPPRADEPEAVTVWREQELGAFEHDPSLNPEHLDLTRSAAEASRVLDAPGLLFGDVPLIVLSASESRAPFNDLPRRIIERWDRIWHEEQRSLAAESSDGTYEVVAGSRHNIQVEQPQPVIEAVESVLSATTRD